MNWKRPEAVEVGFSALGFQLDSFWRRLLREFHWLVPLPQPSGELNTLWTSSTTPAAPGTEVAVPGIVSVKVIMAASFCCATLTTFSASFLAAFNIPAPKSPPIPGIELGSREANREETSPPIASHQETGVCSAPPAPPPPPPDWKVPPTSGRNPRIVNILWSEPK